MNKAQAYLTQTSVYARRLAEAMEMALGQLENNVLFDKVRSIATSLKTFGDQITLNLNDWSNQLGKMFQSENYARAAAQWAGGFDTAMYLKRPSTAATAALLDGGSEGFDLTLESNFVLSFRDSAGGPQKTVDFSDLLAPATLTLALTAPASSSTSDDPGGTGGASPLMKGASVTVTADGGTPVSVALDGLDVSSAAAMAKSLAGLLSSVASQGGFTVTSSGASVTLSGKKKGALASLVVGASPATVSGLGLEGAAVSPSTVLSADVVKARLAALVGTSATVTLAGSAPLRTVRVKSSTTGASSYLEFAGPLSVAIFGADPATAKGSDPLDASTGFTQWTNYLIGTTRLATPLQQAAQPIFESMQQFGDTMAKLDSALKSLQKALFGASSVPSVGIVAGKGGITLAAQGKLTGSAHSVVLYAHGKAATPPNNEKQTIFETLVGNPVYLLNKKLEDAMEVDATKRPSLETEGSVAAFSNGFMNFVSERAIHLLSLKSDVRAIGTTVHVDGTSNVDVTAHSGRMRLRGTSIEIGGVASPAALAAVGVGAGDEPRAVSSLGVKVIAERLELASQAADGQRRVEAELSREGFTVSVREQPDAAADKPLLVQPVPAMVSVGYTQTYFGARKSTGNAVVMGEKKVMVGAGGGASQLVITPDKTTLGGTVDIGGALTIKGAAAAKFEDVKTAKAMVDAKLTQLENKQKLAVTQVVAASKAVALANEKLEALRLLGEDEANAAEAAALAVRTKLEAKLAVVRAEADLLLAQLVAMGVEKE